MSRSRNFVKFHLQCDTNGARRIPLDSGIQSLHLERPVSLLCTSWEYWAKTAAIIDIDDLPERIMACFEL